MQVLMCNSFYYLRGGVERCFFDLQKLLEAHGHQTIPFCMHHERNFPTPYSRYFVSSIDFPSLLEQRNGLLTRLRVAERVLYSGEARWQMERLLADVHPDIAHVQEIDHEISPSILPVLRAAGIPVVQTLHDYKQLCPNTNFVSHGQVCERCRGRRYYHAVLRRCKRGSLSASLLAGLETSFHQLLRIWDRNVDVFIVPSRFLQRKLAEHGFRGRVVLLPHFVDLDRFQPRYEPGDYLLYFGRLVDLKGVRTLLEAMRHVRPSARLVVAGDGELEAELRATAQQHGLSNVTFAGYLATDELIPLVQRAICTVFPSECYENYPLAVVESLACGTPVIGSDIGGIPDLVEDGVSGLLFESGNARQLAERIESLLADPQRAVEMGRNGRRQVEANNDPQHHYRQLMALYQSLLNR